MQPARSQLLALREVEASAEPEARAPAESHSKSSPLDRICVAAVRSVLVVDDNDRHLDILDTILSSVGHDVETCGSGLDAIRRLDQDPFDVVVLDWVMPEIGGYAVADAMRSGIVNARTPLIICTANVGIARRQIGSLTGVSAVIAKPIDTAGLVMAVARAPARELRPQEVRH